MRHCSFCDEKVYTVEGCKDRKLVFGDDTDGTIRRERDSEDLVDPIAYGDEDSDDDVGEQCNICRTEPGRYHHPGCTTEECPNCGDRLVTCDCHPHTLIPEEPEP